MPDRMTHRAHVIGDQMADGYDPPSAWLTPAAADRPWTDADRELVASLVRALPPPARWPGETGSLGPSAEEFADRVLDALTAAGKLRTGDPATTFDEFWADLVTTDGQLDADKVRAELHDYYLVMGEVAKVYSELTDGRISKPHTLAHHVIAEANEAAERTIRPAVAEEIADAIEAKVDPWPHPCAEIARAHATTEEDPNA